MGRPIAELAAAVAGDLHPAHADLVVDDVTHDSRQAEPGSLFVAVRGESFDGHQFVAEAAGQGAVAACVDHLVEHDIPQIVVTDTRRALGPLAAAAHGDPSREMKVIGVTGTNGKTTVTHYIESMARNGGLRVGLIGTIETRIDGVGASSLRTTPEASDLQRLLAQMRDARCEMVATEVSSHALALERVKGTRFEIAAFTNLSQDHLDFHGTMADYLAAKRRLFTDYEVGTAVVNIDDVAGRSIADGYEGAMVKVGVGGDVYPERARLGLAGADFALHTPWGTRGVHAPVLGRPNLDNAVLAATCLLVAGVELDTVVGGLETLEQVPGRFEVVSGTDPIRVVVDYAHTPEAVNSAVVTASSLTGGRVIVVIGAGGERDRAKRPLMGSAATGADLVVVTSDNPRSEDPEVIAEEVASGVGDGPRLLIETDRRLAIRAGLDDAEDGDVVLVLGRGHEPQQEISGGKTPFDDRVVAREELARRRHAAGDGSRRGSMSR